MKPEQLLIWINKLAKESRFPDTIFLHKQGFRWMAYEYSALLLQRYFSPVILRTTVKDPVRLIYASVKNIKSIQELAGQTTGFSWSHESPGTVIINCPAPINDNEALSAIDEIRQSASGLSLFYVNLPSIKKTDVSTQNKNYKQDI